MKIINAWPPNIETIRTTLNVPDDRVIFTYGDTIYNPGCHELDAGLIAHEQVHEKQQAECGGPEAWWTEYLRDQEFRARQEVAAYRAQFRALRRTVKDRNYIARNVHEWASALAGEMYGGCLSYADAVRKIKAGIV